MLKPFPWPLAQMQVWYERDGKTLQEIADLLSSDGWQAYWRTVLGREYRPGQKIVNKVCKRAGFAMRKTGAVGSRNGSWAGGRTVDKCGYILVQCPGHPAANSHGYIREHRLVAEKMLGRLLLPTEVCHHINDDPADNRPENLLVFETNGEHLAHSLVGKCPKWTEDGRQRIAAACRKGGNRVADLRASGDLPPPKYRRRQAPDALPSP